MSPNVQIHFENGGWRYLNRTEQVQSEPFDTYYEAIKVACGCGHEVDNAGWKHKLLTWNFNNHALDGYPWWEKDGKHPAFVQLQHVRGKPGRESSDLANAWDDIATADFYQRDWTSDGLPFVSDGETYVSGWWFQTIAERDRFVAWHAAQETL